MDKKNELFITENFEMKFQTEPIKNSLMDQMVAMGKALMRAKKVMTIDERKLLIMALTKIKWTKENESNKNGELVVCLSKLEIAEMLDWNYDYTDRGTKVRKLATNLAHNSWIKIDGQDDDWDDGFLIPRTRSRKGNIYIYFASQFKPLIENLTKDKDFVTIWANDIYKFDSVFSYLFFEELRLHCDTRTTNFRTYSTKQLKEIFGLDKEAYMRTVTRKGVRKDEFNRDMFEKRVLDVAIAEINKGSMIRIYPIPGSAELKKGKFYEKVKKNGYIVGYRFKYVVRTQTTPPAGYIDESSKVSQEEVLENEKMKNFPGQASFSDAKSFENYTKEVMPAPPKRKQRANLVLDYPLDLDDVIELVGGAEELVKMLMKKAKREEEKE